MATRSLSVNTPAVLYSDTLGWSMNDGDALVATIVSTGAPAALTNPVIRLDIQRNTR